MVDGIEQAPIGSLPCMDMVNHPPHYTSGRYEVIDVLEDWFGSEPLLWQVVKYIARWDKKGDPIENLAKAEFYLKRKIEQLKIKQVVPKSPLISPITEINGFKIQPNKFTGLPPSSHLLPCSDGQDL